MLGSRFQAFLLNKFTPYLNKFINLFSYLLVSFNIHFAILCQAVHDLLYVQSNKITVQRQLFLSTNSLSKSCYSQNYLILRILTWWFSPQSFEIINNKGYILKE